MPKFPSYRNQKIDFQNKLINWFLYDGNFWRLMRTLAGFVPFWSCVDIWSACQLLYLFWMNDIAALFTDKSKGWNLLVRLWDTITISQLFSPYSSLKVSLSSPLNVSILIKECCYDGECWIFQVAKNYLFKKFHRFVSAQSFPIKVTKKEKGKENFRRLRLVFPE